MNGLDRWFDAFAVTITSGMFGGGFGQRSFWGRDSEGLPCYEATCLAEAEEKNKQCWSGCREAGKEGDAHSGAYGTLLCHFWCFQKNSMNIYACRQHVPCGITCCGPPETCCGGFCCEPGMYCVDDQCQKCPAGFKICPSSSMPNECMNVTSDRYHCGSCDVSCAASEVCCEGQCRPAQDWIECGGKCTPRPNCQGSQFFSSVSCECECAGVSCEPGFDQNPINCLCQERVNRCPGGGECYRETFCCQNENAVTCCNKGQICDKTGQFWRCLNESGGVHLNNEHFPVASSTNPKLQLTC